MITTYCVICPGITTTYPYNPYATSTDLCDTHEIKEKSLLKNPSFSHLPLRPEPFYIMVLVKSTLSLESCRELKELQCMTTK